MKIRDLFLGCIAVMFLAVNSPVSAQTVLTSDEAAKVVKFENLIATPEKISGAIHNTSAHTIKDVELLIQYHWLWNNERNPGQNPPGRAAIIKLEKELRPGETLPFSYTPLPPLPSRADGSFMPEVDVAGFALIVPQQAASLRQNR